MQNVPAGDSWWLPIVANPAVLAVINMLIDASMLKWAADWLSKRISGVTSKGQLDVKAAMKFNRILVSITLTLQLYLTIFAPVISMFILDEVRICLSHSSCVLLSSCVSQALSHHSLYTALCSC